MEHLTISQARNEVKKLENELELYLTKKKITFEKTQPSSPKFKDVIPGRSNSQVVFDKFTHYVIKNDEYDATIYAIQESINAYEKYIIEEMKRISNSKADEKIIFYRDEENKSWEEIANIIHYSVRQCQRLYNKK